LRLGVRSTLVTGRNCVESIWGRFLNRGRGRGRGNNCMGIAMRITFSTTVQQQEWVKPIFLVLEQSLLHGDSENAWLHHLPVLIKTGDM
jgi:hypothetical protein